MLNLSGLESKLKQCFDDTIPEAFTTAFKEYVNVETEENNKRAEQFGETVCQLLSEPWAKQIAAAIDYYIKSGCICGTLITAGSPVTQTCVIPPGVNLGNPVAGSVPNTLGIK
jgi:hypothetical protein